MDHARYAALFLSESREHLGTCNQLLAQLEANPHDRDAIGGVFRAMHTIKGMAAMMGYPKVNELAHQTENLLERVRSGAVAPDQDLVQLLAEAIDGLDAGVEQAAAGNDDQLDFDGVLGRIDLLVGEAADTPFTIDTAEIPIPRPPVRRGARSRAVKVSLVAGTTMPGARAAVVLAQAHELGQVTDVQPRPSEFEQEGFSGTFSFYLETGQTASAVEQALRKAGHVDSVVFGEGVKQERAQQGDDPLARAQDFVRVDRRRLDALINHVGELVVARNRLLELAVASPGSELEALSTRINRLVADVQGEVLLARLTPVSQVFDRFPRAVRDLARELGKQVSIQVEGADIEVDRAILDEIGDPILHLLRNAVDHGIESPQEREAAGKPSQGQLRLSCRRERNAVVFQLSDDGRGVDREAVLAMAIEKGLADPETEELSDDQLIQLLGRAGFSTAESVTTVSGRGVGIDVVVTRLRAVGGNAQIETVEGKGTTFTLRVPLTLVIFRALLAQAGSERYVIPMAYVSETVEYWEGVQADLHGRPALVLRDQVIPAVELRSVVGLAPEATAPRRPCAVLDTGERQTALVVDALLGQQEIVVEHFEPPRGMPALFSGATILADGTPALILDAAALG